MNTRKNLIAKALGAALAIGVAAPVVAAPVFTINPLALPVGTSPRGITEAAFQADFVSGASSVRITQNSAASQSLNGLLSFGQFTLNGATILPNTSGLLIDYNLYALFTGTTTLTGGPGGAAPGSTYSLTSLNFQVFADINTNGVVTQSTLLAPPSISNTGDDLLLATGGIVSGTAGFNNLGGAFFNAITTFNVCSGAGTAQTGPNPACTSNVGSQFFALPSPFYTLSFQEFNNTTQGITTNCVGVYPCIISVTNESGGVDFNNVPEPGTVALLGIALAGFGFTSRRGKKA